MPTERKRIIHHRKADLTSAYLRNTDPTSRSLRDMDLTSRSLRDFFRRGTLVVPGDRGWMIKRQAADVTSTSLRAESHPS